ncbi:MAG: DUF6291 domain-containing protein [Treponema sp.]|nr:DUF6291 domain-containing protein [Treponema sp.]
MAGDYLLTPHKLWEALEAGNLSEIEQYRFLKKVLIYEQTRVEPNFSKGEEFSLWIMYKPELEKNMEKWEAEVKRRAELGKAGGSSRSELKIKKALENGKLGGAPEGNQNAKKQTFEDYHDNITQNNSTQSLLRLPNENNSTQADNDNDIGNGYVYNNVNVNSPAIDGGENTLTIIFIKIQKISKEVGFDLDDAAVKRIQANGLDPFWLKDPYSFLRFTAEILRKQYPKKTDDDLKKMYYAALFKPWNDLIEGFPSWRAGQERIAENRTSAAEKEYRITEARANPPRTCFFCGTNLEEFFNDRSRCPKCKAICILNESGLYQWDESLDIVEEFARLAGKKELPEQVSQVQMGLPDKPFDPSEIEF